MQLADVVVSLDAYRRRRDGSSEFIPTGSMGLDSALGGGWRKGRIAELLGDYGTCKTALALQAVATAQGTGTVLWLDGASDFSPAAARSAGADLRTLILSRPGSAWEALRYARECASVASLIVIDRASGLDLDGAGPQGFFERELAWLKSDLITASCIFITDAEKQGDNAFVTALRTWSTQRVILYPRPNMRVQAVVTKNQIVAPHDVPINLRFHDYRLDSAYELIRLAQSTGHIQKRGSWYYLYEGTQLGHGIENAIRTLYAEPGLEQIIRKEVGASIAI